MIDEKKIEEAARECRFNTIAQMCSVLNEQEATTLQKQVNLLSEIIDGVFEKGINWFLDNLWHDTSEEPRDKSAILLKYTSPFCEWATLDEVDADDWNDTVEELGITRWKHI